MSIVALSIAVLLATPAAAGPPVETSTAAPEPEVITGADDGHLRMTVPVRIGERDASRFLVDTGSQQTVLSTDLAQRLALPPATRRRIVGIAGRGTAATARLDSLALGRRSFTNLEVLLFAARDIGADGVLGIDSLQRQRVLMDFDANTMAVGDAKSTGGNSGFDIVVTARRRSGQLIITNAVIDGVRTSVVIDTGSDTTLGNRALQRALRHDNPGSQVKLQSVTGASIMADLAVAKRIEIDTIVVSNALIAYSDSPTFAALDLERRPALLLGMRELRLFRRIAIDFANRKVLFDMPPTAALTQADFEVPFR